MNYLDIKNGDINKNIYLLSGDDYLINETKNIIAQRLGVNKINITEFNDENFDEVDVINACNQFSFFNEKRIIYIYNVEKELNATQKQQFLNYENKPNLDCVLLINNNNAVFGFLKSAEIVECKPSEISINCFIENEFKIYGKKIDMVANKKLAGLCLNNMNRLKTEIKKICDYLNDCDIVTERIVEDLVVQDLELKVFDLTIALSNKNIQKSQELLFNMLNSGEPPIRILGLISGHFRRMFFAKINKGTAGELAKHLNCKEYAIIKAKSQADKFTAKQLKDIQNLILETDYNIKNGVFSQENALYYIIYKICN